MQRHVFFTLIVLAASLQCFSQANTTLSNLVSPTAINQHLLPSSNNSKDLGSTSRNWRNLFFAGNWYKGSLRFISTPGRGNSFLGIQSGKSTTSGNYNTAVGDSAMLKNTTGNYNTALGYQALDSNTIGGDNTAYGALALFSNTVGNFNTAIGFQALYFNTTAYYNTATGLQALFNNTTGYDNTATGSQALFANTTGFYNTATGAGALGSNTIGVNNTATGYQALYSNITGNYNTAVGTQTLLYNTTGGHNTATGNAVLYSNTTGSNNTTSGFEALYSNTSGNDNTAMGNQALRYNTIGYQNTASGTFTLGSNTTGYYNTANGSGALSGNTTGYDNAAYGVNALQRTTVSNYNTAVGYNAGSKYDNGWYNVFVGSAADVNAAGYYNAIVIGQNAVGTGSNQVRIGNISIASIGGYQNWTNISDGRYKKNIKEDVPGLSFITKLHPVTYNLDATGLDAFLHKGTSKEVQPTAEGKSLIDKALKEKEAVVQTGFIAQEVEKAAKELQYDFSGVDKPKNDGDVYGLRYSEFVVPLVKAVQELDSTVKAKDQRLNQQQQQIDELRQMLLELKNGQNNLLSVPNAYLEQAMPNPAQTKTTVRYGVPISTSSAKLILTNASGQTLKEIILTKGTGQLNLNTASLASGVYNYTLYVDGKQTDSKQLVIAR